VHRRTAVIVPAYNEAGTIGQVLDVLMQLPELGAIIVVDDGSDDGTGAAVAPYRVSNERVRLISLPENRGKGAALETGVLACEEDQVLFLDADLIGLQPKHVKALIGPVREGTCAMTIGIFHDRGLRIERAHRSMPWLTGQRCLSRCRFLSVPSIARTGMGVELALTVQARRSHWQVKQVAMPGVTHCRPEEKRGLWPGLRQRCRMWSEIALCWLRTRHVHVKQMGRRGRRSRRAEGLS
jgi:hypothetical protein